MAIMSLIGLFLWRWIENSRQPNDRPQMQQQLNEAQAALEGFLLANHRLPCAANSRDGNESCSNSNAIYLPWRLLGLSSNFDKLHYGVNRGADMDLATLPSALVAPDLNIDFLEVPTQPTYPSDLSPSADVTAAATAAQTAINKAKTRRNTVNGLDWCRVLRNYAANPSATGALTAGSSSNNISVAYLLVHPGKNQEFDGNNSIGASATFKFDFPGRAQANDFDDISLAIGATDLSSRIGCVSRLSQMQAAGQGAYAAYDNLRVVQQYWSFRVFDIEAAESALTGAESGVTMADLGLALTAVSTALSIASAANTEGLTTFGIALAATNVGIAVIEKQKADQDLVDAKKALADAKDKLKATETYAASVYKSFTQSLDFSIQLDTKGLNP